MTTEQSLQNLAEVLPQLVGPVRVMAGFVCVCCAVIILAALHSIYQARRQSRIQELSMGFAYFLRGLLDDAFGKLREQFKRGKTGEDKKPEAKA